MHHFLTQYKRFADSKFYGLALAGGACGVVVPRLENVGKRLEPAALGQLEQGSGSCSRGGSALLHLCSQPPGLALLVYW
jgi:hypothetical protein